MKRPVSLLLKSPEVENVWVDFWQQLLCDDAGAVDLDKVKAELYDFHALIGNVSKVYDHVTGGKVSKPLTDPGIVCEMADDYYSEQCRLFKEEEREDFANELELRRLLWLRHGHGGLYGDDGEMQCGTCRLDFKRDSVEAIDASFNRQALQSLREFELRKAP